MNGIENRRANRFDVNINAKLHTASAEFSGTITNISATGAGLGRTFVNLNNGERISIRTTEHGIFRGTIQWKSSSGFGVLFDAETQRSSNLRRFLRELREMARFHKPTLDPID